MKAEFEAWLAGAGTPKHFRDCKHKHHYITECGCWMRRIFEAGRKLGLSNASEVTLDAGSIKAIAKAIKHV
jgi:hypothetical protein